MISSIIKAFALDPFWTYLIEGDLLGMVSALWVSAVGEWIYGVTIMSLAIMLYGRVENFFYLAIVWVLAGGVLIVMIPMAGWGLLAIGLYFSIGGLLFYLTMRIRG